MNWLLTAVSDTNLNALLLKLTNSSNATIVAALNETMTYNECSDCNALHVAARAHDGEGFAALVDCLTQEQLEEWVPKRSGWGHNALYAAVVFQRSPEGVIRLLNKLSPDVIRRCLSEVDINGWTGLMSAAEFQEEEVQQQLFTMIDDEVIAETLTTVDEELRSGFQILMHRLPKDLMLSVINRMESSTLEKAIPLKSPEQFNGLHLTAFKQDAALAKAVLNKLSDATLARLALMNDHESNNYLHALASIDDSELIISLMKRLPADVFEQALLQLSSTRMNPYGHMAYNQSEDTMAQVTQQLSDEALNKAVAHFSRDNTLNPLVRFAENKSEEFFLAVWQRLSDDVIKKVALFPHLNNWCVVTYCALRMSSKTVLTLLERLSTEQLDSILAQQLQDDSYTGWNLLNLLAVFHDATVFSAAVNKASPIVIEKALLTKCRNDNAQSWTVMHHVLNFQPEEDILNLMGKVSDDVINKAMLVANIDNWTALTFAIYYASPTVLLELLPRLTSDTLTSCFTRASTIIESRNASILNQLLARQPYEVITAYCDRLDVEILESCFCEKVTYDNLDGVNALIQITQKHTHQLLEYFLQCIPRQAFVKAMQQKTIGHTMALHYAAHGMRAESVMALCELLNDDEFSELIIQVADMDDVRNVTPFHAALTGQFPDVGQYFIARITPAALEKVLQIKTFSGFSPLPLILTIYDYDVIQSVLQRVDRHIVARLLQEAHQHFYQIFLSNAMLTDEQVNELTAYLSEVEQGI